MAASTRAITPTHTGHFAAANAPSTPTSISSVAQPIATSQNLATRLTTKSPLPGLSPRLSPQPLTGAAAMADERRLREQQAREQSRQTSPNPAMNALKSLVGADQSPMSRPADAPPAPTQISEPLAKATKNIVIPEQVTHDNMQTSPVSLSSFGSADSTTAPTATATEATTGPLALGSIPVDGAIAQNSSNAPFNGPGDTPTGARAFTYPGPPPDHDPRAPQRGMSLPGYPQNSPKSPSTKRHKCPYCATDFTRHHNLKSHLLTHSQEKPYECPTCQARFRRLHDLKRHTKLHTGERPHTCPKCGRRFARGDALARHNKGQGGCAGRRSSFGMDEDMDGKGDEGMDGVLYHGDHGDEEKDDDENSGGRRVSEPARKRQNTGNSMQGPYHQHSSTYPPVASRVPNMGSNNTNARPIFTSSQGVSGSSRDQSANLSPKNAPSSLSSIHPYANQSGTFAGMTESPKPISPGQTDNHHRLGVSEASTHPGARSPSMSQQIHQHNFPRGAGRGSSPMGLPPPPHGNSNAPQLPSLPGLGPSDIRMNLPNKGPQPASKAGPSLLQHQQVPGPGAQPPSNPGSMSSHTTNSGNSMRDHMSGDMWAYMREMEARFARQTEDQQAQIVRLKNEVTTLQAQLAQASAQSQNQQAPQAQPQP